MHLANLGTSPRSRYAGAHVYTAHLPLQRDRRHAACSSTIQGCPCHRRWHPLGCGWCTATTLANWKTAQAGWRHVIAPFAAWRLGWRPRSSSSCPCTRHTHTGLDRQEGVRVKKRWARPVDTAPVCACRHLGPRGDTAGCLLCHASAAMPLLQTNACTCWTWGLVMPNPPRTHRSVSSVARSSRQPSSRLLESRCCAILIYDFKAHRIINHKWRNIWI